MNYVEYGTAHKSFTFSFFNRFPAIMTFYLHLWGFVVKIILDSSRII